MWIERSGVHERVKKYWGMWHAQGVCLARSVVEIMRNWVETLVGVGGEEGGGIPTK